MYTHIVLCYFLTGVTRSMDTLMMSLMSPSSPSISKGDRAAKSFAGVTRSTVTCTSKPSSADPNDDADDGIAAVEKGDVALPLTPNGVGVWEWGEKDSKSTSPT